MRVQDHLRPDSCPTTFQTYAAPVGCEAGVVTVYGRGDRLYLNPSYGSGRGFSVGSFTSGQGISQAVGENNPDDTIKADALVVPQLVPFCLPRPLVTPVAHPDEYVLSELITPTPGRTALLTVGRLGVVRGSFGVRPGALRVDWTGPPTTSVLGIRPDGSFSIGRYNDSPTPVIEQTLTFDESSQPPTVALGNNGHGMWLYRHAALNLAEAVDGQVKWKAYHRLFPELEKPPPDPLPPPQRVYGLGERRPFLVLPRAQLSTPTPEPVELFATSQNHAFRITFPNKNPVEMVVERRKLNPYDDTFEVREGWTIPTEIQQANLQQTSVCLFISSDESVLMIYLPIYMGSAGGKQWLARTITLDLE